MKDHYKTITDKIVSQLEQGTKPWNLPFFRGGGSIPHNITTKSNYRGMNVIILWLNQMENKFDTCGYLTFNQAKKAGSKIKKGSKGEPVYFFSTYESENKQTGKKASVPFMKKFTVFNREQVEGMEVPEEEKNHATINKVEKITEILRASGAKIEEGGRRACYIPSTDTIKLPDISKFKSEEGYCGAVIHELAHWTSGKDRVERNLSYDHQTESYAREELRAEIASVFVCSYLGIPYEIENHASYIDIWLDALKNDKKEIFKAASNAQKIADYIINLTKKEEEENE
jgi:antirestriction protein ArdC